MLRALARELLADAVVQGAACASFHGYGIAARRLSAAGAVSTFVELTLAGGSGAELLDRVRIAVAFRSDPGSACRIDHSRVPAIAARRAESLAGCVSPVDARYASPETGQIS
ncbi:MAG: hypothetical protein M9907_17195 [Burkholderiaceae bacterium]|nr:hypothetical protein [Burkholderiaceae bacterium]